MLGIGRKPQEPNSGESRTKSEGQYAPPKGLETVCPEVGDLKHRFYDRPAVELAQRLGSLAMEANSEPGEPSRINWQYAVATEAINMLDNYPTQAIAQVHGDNRWDFHRAVYWRALVAGLGEWIANSRFRRKNGESVNPLREGWSEVQRLADGTGQGPNPEAFAPSIGEYMMAEQIGVVELAGSLDTTVRNLFWDSFGADHHPRNIFAASAAKAQKKVATKLAHRGFSLDDKYGTQWLRPTQTLQIEQPAGNSDVQGQQEEAGASAAEPSSPAKRKEAIPQSGEQPARTASVAQAGKADKPAKANGEEGPGSRQLAKAGISTGSDDIENRLVRTINERIDSGVIRVNEPGALILTTEHGPGFVQPKAELSLGEMMGVPAEAVRTVIESTSLSDYSHPGTVYRIKSKGRGWKKLKIMVMDPEFAKRIPALEGLAPNEDIRKD